MRSLLLATRSAHKAAEIRRILEPLELRVESLADRGIQPDPAEDDIESHDSFRDNAVAKARWFAARLETVALADDSGLRVDALDGEPGVRTKRFSGRTDLEGRPLDDANNALLLERLREVDDDRRGARYVCCAAVAWPDGRAITAMGTVSGRIARDSAGQGGFGYDPLFYVPQLGARFAEVDPGVKDAMSHRARAFRALAASLLSAPWPVGARSGADRPEQNP